MTDLNDSDDLSVSKSVKKISDIIEQPEKFAQIFCEAAEKQKSIDRVLCRIFKDLLTKDHETKEILKNAIKEVEKEDWRFVWKKFGLAISTGLAFIAGSAVTAFISKVIR